MTEAKPIFEMKQGHVKVVFMDGTWIDFPKPPTFDLPAYVHGIRSLGFMLTGSFYIPAHMIKLIMDMDSTAQVEGLVPQQTAPSTDSKQ